MKLILKLINSKEKKSLRIFFSYFSTFLMLASSMDKNLVINGITFVQNLKIKMVLHSRKEQVVIHAWQVPYKNIQK